MVYKKKLRSGAYNKQNQSKKYGKNECSFDIWLKRFSYISQTCLFVLTAVTLYFTVLPLYQKALLDEEIAKKEIELRKANDLFDKIYFQTRKYLLNHFVLYINTNCSAMIKQLKDDKDDLAELPKLDATKILDFDVQNCIQNKAQQSESLQLLRIDDKKYVTENMLVISDELNNARLLAKKEYSAVLDKGMNNPDSLPTPGYFVQQYIDKFAPYFSSPQEISDITIKARIEAEQSRIVSDYSSNVSQKIISLRLLKWPIQNAYQ
ncbi:conserved hypothetical protein [Nitrosomonas nitrosa]|uniref:Uncharacterized protein n=1 Tax=Nitrosomonas nitrosa TaxID=52442 RepID=A0A8H8Z1J4_9PROT|nr:hypothetical protein [Nitrosomonas nitrosa]CAE6506084.1 conserved hypothetical protein [Nitrosomonas nitrosa]